MKNNVSVACLTADLLGGRSFSINYHLFTVINAICENISISSIHLYTTSINDFSSGSLQEIQADFHIHFPVPVFMYMRWIRGISRLLGKPCPVLICLSAKCLYGAIA